MTAQEVTAKALEVLVILDDLTDDEACEALTAAARARGIRARFGDCCPQGHPYDEANTMRTKRGHRVCRACHNAEVRDYQRRRRAAKKAAGEGS